MKLYSICFYKYKYRYNIGINNNMPKLTTRPNRTLLPTDYAYAVSADGTQDGKVQYSAIAALIGSGGGFGINENIQVGSYALVAGDYGATNDKTIVYTGSGGHTFTHLTSASLTASESYVFIEHRGTGILTIAFANASDRIGAIALGIDYINLRPAEVARFQLTSTANVWRLDRGGVEEDKWVELAHIQYDGAGVTSFEQDFNCGAYDVVRIKGNVRCATVSSDYHDLRLTVKLLGVEKVLNYIGSWTSSANLSAGVHNASSTVHFPVGTGYANTTDKVSMNFDLTLSKNNQGLDINSILNASTEASHNYRTSLGSGRLNDIASNLDGIILRCFQSVNRNFDFADFKIFGGHHASI